MKKFLAVLHCFQEVNKNTSSPKKEHTMSDLKHPLIEQAYDSAEDCYAQANATIYFLDQAMKPTSCATR